MRVAPLVACCVLVACSGPGAVAVDEPMVAAGGEAGHDAGMTDAPAPPDAAAADAQAAPTKVPTRGRVTVAFSVRPRVFASAPTLHVAVHNPGPDPVPFTRFSNAVCFKDHYLSIELRPARGKAPVPTRCVVKTWPGTDEPLGAMQTATVELPLGELFTGLRKGVYEIDVTWDPSGMESVRPGEGVYASGSSQDVTSFAIAKPLSTFRIQQGKRVALPGGARLTFSSHGHKSVMAGGPPSPLIVHGSFWAKGAQEEEFSASVFEEESRFFSIEEHLFELVGHEYDRWMDLRYFGRLVLE